MARRRVSITLDDDVIARARRWARARGGLSSYVQEALLERIRRDEEEKLSAEERGRELLAWFEELEAADPSTPEEREEAKRWVDEIQAKIERNKRKYPDWGNK